MNIEHAPIGRLDGLRALVTGAAGGLGRDIGDCLAQQGAEVFGTSRTADSAAEIAAHYGTLPVVLDATKRADAMQVVTELYDRVGGIPLAHLTRILALEWAPYGIRVNAVAPTFVRTALTESTFSRPGLEEKLTARIPLGRLGVTNDVAPAVAFLLSEDAGLITGHVLAIDGGYTIH